MYFKTPEEDYNWVTMSPGVVLSIVIAIIGVLYLGILPGEVMALAKLAIY